MAPVAVEFDPEKDFRNRLKHGFSLQRAKDLDWDRAFIKADLRFDYGEKRYIALGLIEHRLYCVVFVRRVDAIRIISFRKANRREVLAYDGSQEKVGH